MGFTKISSTEFNFSYIIIILITCLLIVSTYVFICEISFIYWKKCICTLREIKNNTRCKNIIDNFLTGTRFLSVWKILGQKLQSREMSLLARISRQHLGRWGAHTPVWFGDEEPVVEIKHQLSIGFSRKAKNVHVNTYSLSRLQWRCLVHQDQSLERFVLEQGKMEEMKIWDILGDISGDTPITLCSEMEIWE